MYYYATSIDQPESPSLSTADNFFCLCGRAASFSLQSCTYGYGGIHSEKEKAENFYFYLRHKNSNKANLNQVFNAYKNQKRIRADSHWHALTKLNIALLNSTH